MFYKSLALNYGKQHFKDIVNIDTYTVTEQHWVNNLFILGLLRSKIPYSLKEIGTGQFI